MCNKQDISVPYFDLTKPGVCTVIKMEILLLYIIKMFFLHANALKILGVEVFIFECYNLMIFLYVFFYTMHCNQTRADQALSPVVFSYALSEFSSISVSSQNKLSLWIRISSIVLTSGAKLFEIFGTLRLEWPMSGEDAVNCLIAFMMAL